MSLFCVFVCVFCNLPNYPGWDPQGSGDEIWEKPVVSYRFPASPKVCQTVQSQMVSFKTNICDLYSSDTIVKESKNL